MNENTSSFIRQYNQSPRRFDYVTRKEVQIIQKN